MQDGSFYCFVPRSPGAQSWLPFSKSTGKALSARFDALLGRSLTGSPGEGLGAGGRLGLESSDSEESDSEDIRGQGVQDFVSLGTSYGVSVRAGARGEGTDGWGRVRPHVYTEGKTTITFYGFLTNTEEQLQRLDLTRFSAASGCDGWQGDRLADLSAALGAGGDGATPRADYCTLSAAVLLHLYLREGRENPLLMLSELQGRFAFVICDGKKKRVLAARDPSGSQPLYYYVGDDGSVSFTNFPLDVPSAERTEQWTAIPPGHYVFGKRHPKLKQYALTPEELTAVREEEVLEEEDFAYPRSPTGTRANMNRTASTQSATTGVFSMEF